MISKTQEVNQIVSNGIDHIQTLQCMLRPCSPRVEYWMQSAIEDFQRIGVFTREQIRATDQALDEVQNLTGQYKALMGDHLEQNEVVVVEANKAAAAYAMVGRLMALFFLDGVTNQHPVLAEARNLLSAGAFDYMNNAQGLIDCGCNPEAANRAEEVANWWTAPIDLAGNMGIETDSPYSEHRD